MKDFLIPEELKQSPEIREILIHPHFTGMKKYRHHGEVSCHAHTLRVTEHSFRLSSGRRVNVTSLIRGALLHDFYLYDWHGGCPPFHGFRHPGWALDNAREHFGLNEIEEDIIRKHMFPLTPGLPLFTESAIVSVADKIAAWNDYQMMVGDYLRRRFRRRRNKSRQTQIHH
ncbi:MAG: phosphohydrolase [Spirochaetales bacterium]|nr:phosphohydrolase [Spirochaetales bacterium]